MNIKKIYLSSILVLVSFQNPLAQTLGFPPLPTGEPVLISPERKLTFTEGLSLGELAELHWKKQEEGILNNLGYTKKKSEPPPKAKAFKPIQKSKPSKPKVEFIVLAVFGPDKAEEAEVAFNNTIYRVKGGESFGKFTIKSISDRGVELEYNAKTVNLTPGQNLSL